MKRQTLLLTVLVLLMSTAALNAQPRRISPGKLSTPHESLEGIDNCTKCHELGKGVSEKLCLDCHVALAVRIENELGLHATPEHKERSCVKCHSEHHGREYKLVYWPEGESAFDHGQTGYNLTGAHDSLKCEQCHQQVFIRDKQVLEDKNVALDHTRLGLSQACASCHNDEHGDQLPDDCQKCHTTEAWSPASGFNHAESPYPLTGKHKDLSCEKCHPWQPANMPSFEGALMKKEHVGESSAYRLPGRFPNCTPCHTDPHEGRYKKSCEECHRTVGWANLAEGNQFDHDLTDYPLRGRHRVVDCGDCHKTAKRTDPLPHATCTDCHADEHRGQFANRKKGITCEPCHTVEGFVPAKFTLEQHQQTRYRLEGSHLAIPCNLCHKQVSDGKGETYAQFTYEDRTCHACHRDPHGGRLNRWIEEGGCELCHNVETWHRTSFDHNRTDWALTGKHREVGCLECHREEKSESGEEMVWFKPESTDCAFCHNDQHQGQFLAEGAERTECARCHDTQGWKTPNLKFDHERDSRFSLRGAHTKVACNQCHLPEIGANGAKFVRYKPLEGTCASCHLPEKVDDLQRRLGG